MDKLSFKGLPVKTGSPDSLTYQVDAFDIPIVRAFYKQEIKPEYYLKITVEKWSRNRTLKQNALWHKILQVLSSQMFMDIEIIKEGIKELAMSEYGYPGIENPVTKRLSPKPSRSATVKEMEILFAVTFLVAGDNDIDIRHFVDDVNTWKEKNENMAS